MNRLATYIVLPREVTAFERAYLLKLNRIAIVFFFAHVPVLMAIASVCGTGPWRALLLCSLTLVGPAIAYKTFANPRTLSMVFGFTAMCMGALLVHFGQGPMQIEMHFYFFVLLALLSVFANPMAIIVAATTVALHHLLLYFLMPRSVFNYDASLWAVAVHALFVVLESIAACFVARSFFDNVIGLERIVARRTTELDERNRDLRVVLDNVGQGFLTAVRDGSLTDERSAIVDTWFGPWTRGRTIWDLVALRDSKTAKWLEVGWESIFDDVLPAEVAVDQLPKAWSHGDRDYRIEYKTIVERGAVSKVVLVMSDVTAERARERSEREQREILHVFERLIRDREGFLEFFTEAHELVTRITEESKRNLVDIRRDLHTLKGNAAMFGLTTIASIAHDLETKIVEETLSAIPQAECAELRASWASLSEKLQHFIDGRSDAAVAIDDAEFRRIIDAITSGTPRSELVRLIQCWKLEPTKRRFERVAEQVQGMARRVGKCDVRVEIEDRGIRLPSDRWAPFWSVFVHAVRNSIVHGIEPKGERARAGKSEVGTIWLSSEMADDGIRISLVDDGRGVDWTAIASKAKGAGLLHETRDDLISAMFHDGLSTADAVTEYAGRGVGLGAIRDVVTSLGGSVFVESAPSVGTTICFVFPEDSIAKYRLFGDSSAPVGRSTVSPAAA